MRTHRPLVVSGIGFLLLSCPAKREPIQGPDAGGDDVDGDDAAIAEKDKGLEFKLSEGRPAAEAVDRAKVAAATSLGEKEIAALLARLPPLQKEAGDEQAFALRAASQPPPKTGSTVLASFPGPPQGKPPVVKPGPLTVLRHSPDGEVPIAADFSITFSQPMVAVTSRGELAAAEVPVKMSPQPPGQWVWVGTKTLVFRPTGRFPMATEYTVTVPPGTASAAGAKLSGEVAAIKFGTPPVKLVSAVPRDSVATRSPYIFLSFDQRVDPAAVLPSILVKPSGGKAVALRVVPQAEAVKDRELRGMIESAEAGRWVIIKPTEALPGEAEISVELAVGLPSAEGPRKTTTAESFAFRTYGPMKLQKAECGWSGSECPPGMPFRFEFTNPIDSKRFKKEWVRVEPEIPGMHVAAYGSEIQIQGRTEARTTYKVTVDGALRDEYKQTLGKAVSEKFKVGPAPDSLSAEVHTTTVLDPAARGKLAIFTTGHKTVKVRVHAVTPADWDAYIAWMRARNESNLHSAPPPGKPVFVDSVKIGGDPDELTETGISLEAAFKDGLGHAIVVIEPPKPPKPGWGREQIVTWAQSTRIGLDAFVDGEKMIAFTTHLADGKPLVGAQVRLAPSGVEVKSGADGLATIPLPVKGSRMVQASVGADTAFMLDNDGWYYGGENEMGWKPHKRADQLIWYVFDDRKMYRPGETVRVKGWLRKQTGGLKGGLTLPGDSAKELAYTLHDAQGNKLSTGKVALGALGGFFLELPLPKTPNLGYANLELTVTQGGMKNQSFSHGLQIQEFRRPEYEVTARVNEGPHLVGGHAELTVAAKYFSGGPLPGAEVHWNVSASAGSFVPPGRDEYTFGKWTPWWGDIYRWGGHKPYVEPERFSSRTDGAGEHHLRADFVRVDPPEPTSVHAEATVMDVNRQAWTAGVDLLVHPANMYVGMKSQRLFVQQGEPLEIDAIAVDLDGKAVLGREIVVRSVRLGWEQEAGEFKEVEKDPQECKKTSTEAAVRCSFVPKEGGSFRVTASVRDAEGRPNRSELSLWVAGGEQQPTRGVAMEEVQLVPDKKEYAAGETAKLLVMAPFAPAEGVMTLRREGVVQTRRLSLTGTSTTLEVPIDDAFVPGISVQVDLVGAAARTRDDGKPDPKLPKRPAYASGNLLLAVPARSRTLNLYLKPGAEKLEPGGSTTLEIVVHDAADKPVAGSEVAAVVVDEAVLAIAGYDLLDPIAAFYPQRDPGVADYHSRASVVLANPEDTGVVGGVAGGMVGGAPGGGGGADKASGATAEMAPTMAPSPAPPPPPEAPMSGKGAKNREADNNAPGPAIAVRKNFDALAVFAAALPTDAQGRARVEVKLPDNLTRYRVMAVAVAGSDRFGKAESAITARLPLMVRPSPPRFLNYGDKFELPIVVQNQTDAPMTVDLAMRTANLDLVQGAGRRVQVPANDRVEVRLPAAAVKAGTARFQVAAASGKWADAATGELPVWTPATTEAFATYGQIDSGAVSQLIKPPGDAVAQFGGLELTTSSTAVAELTDAVLYLVRYPFECQEQLASRLLTIAALKDVLAAFNVPDLPKPEALTAFVEADIERLARLQNPDGGWGFWRQGERSWPYLVVHVAHALERARSKGFKVPPATLDRAQDYLRDIESKFDSWYTVEARRAIVAYALYVRQRLGVRDQARAKTLYAEVPLIKHSLETLGWLLPVLGDSPESKAILRHLGNQVRETAGAAHFSTGYSDGAHLLLHSERRVDGVLLDALIGADPQSDLIPKLVRGLLAHRTAGRWGNTQENAFILLALDRYFGAYEKATPDFVARAWLGNKSAGEHKFKGRTTEQHRIDVPMATLIKEGANNLIIGKDGPGRLYYRLGLRYAPKDLNVPAADYGFVVERKYAAVDDKGDVKRDADGTWRIRAGARVEVTLTMVAQDRRYHVALVDPLPAGLEAVNPALATTGALDPSRTRDENGGGNSPYSYGWWWWRPWYEHENLRDERVEAFTPLLWDGVYSYKYIARATTPGNFVVPPAKAEEMYAPETFGRSAGDRVIVE